MSGDGYETTGTDENGVPIIRNQEQYFVAADDYVHIGYDAETGMEIIKKREEISDISNVDLIEGSYDITVDAMDVLNKTTDLVEPAAIKSKTRPGNIGKGAVGAVVGTIVSVFLIGKIGNELYKKDDNGKSAVDRIKDFIWDFANGGLTNGSSCSASE